LLFYTLISSNTTLRYMFAQGRKDGRTNADHYYVTPSLREGAQKGYSPKCRFRGVSPKVH
jgi:hypothetical protein